MHFNRKYNSLVTIKTMKKQQLMRKAKSKLQLTHTEDEISSGYCQLVLLSFWYSKRLEAQFIQFLFVWILLNLVNELLCVSSDGRCDVIHRTQQQAVHTDLQGKQQESYPLKETACKMMQTALTDLITVSR